MKKKITLIFAIYHWLLVERINLMLRLTHKTIFWTKSNKQNIIWLLYLYLYPASCKPISATWWRCINKDKEIDRTDFFKIKKISFILLCSDKGFNLLNCVPVPRVFPFLRTTVWTKKLWNRNTTFSYTVK